MADTSKGGVLPEGTPPYFRKTISDALTMSRPIALVGKGVVP
jgi:hypothetical protein